MTEGSGQRTEAGRQMVEGRYQITDNRVAESLILILTDISAKEIELRATTAIYLIFYLTPET